MLAEEAKIVESRTEFVCVCVCVCVCVGGGGGCERERERLHSWLLDSAYCKLNRNLFAKSARIYEDNFTRNYMSTQGMTSFKCCAPIGLELSKERPYISNLS